MESSAEPSALPLIVMRAGTVMVSALLACGHAQRRPTAPTECRELDPAGSLEHDDVAKLRLMLDSEGRCIAALEAMSDKESNRLGIGDHREARRILIERIKLAEQKTNDRNLDDRASCESNPLAHGCL
jgi:hypothetical protein